jgi:hypothetical protein
MLYVYLEEQKKIRPVRLLQKYIYDSFHKEWVMNTSVAASAALWLFAMYPTFIATAIKQALLLFQGIERLRDSSQPYECMSHINWKQWPYRGIQRKAETQRENSLSFRRHEVNERIAVRSFLFVAHTSGASVAKLP